LTMSAAMPAMNESILVECDDDGVREIASHLLTAAGYPCRKCAAPMGVLDVLNSGEEFDLLLCNLSESVEAGLIERMREKFPDIPVVIMTGVREFSFPAAAVRSGAYDWLLKPFEREELLAVVRRALEYRRLKLENRALRSELENKKLRVGPEEKMITMQDVRERCYSARHYIEAVRGYIDLGNPEKADEFAKKVDEMVLKMLVDATEAAKGTPDYKPNPF
jgi:DNA-binding NtrC family response regulator